MTRVGGRCLCGQASYEIVGGAVLSGSCYCTDYRRETGSGHLTIVGYPEAAIRFTGETRAFTKTSDAGNEVTRFFCPDCGSTVFARSAMTPGLVTICAGSLDDPAGVEVQMAVYCSRAPEWDRPPAGTVSFAEMPGAELMPDMG